MSGNGIKSINKSKNKPKPKLRGAEYKILKTNFQVDSTKSVMSKNSNEKKIDQKIIYI